MIRRCLVASLLTVAVTVAGCGTMKLAQNGEPVWLHHRVDRTFVEPSHRVALATFEVLNAEFSSVNVIAQELSQDSQFDRPDGTTPGPGEVAIPATLPAFWLDGVNPSRPVIVDFRYCTIAGKDREDRQVQVVVRSDPKSSNPGTVVSIQFGRRGDDAAGFALLAKIAERAALPDRPPGSLEERKALQDLFGPRPGEAFEKAKAITSGELWMKKI
jgi:hypothetical protein